MAGSAENVMLLSAGIYISLIWISQGLTVGHRYLSSWLGSLITNRVRKDLLKCSLKLDLAFYQDKPAGEMIERVDNDTEGLANLFSRLVVELLGNFLLLIGIIAIITVHSWKLGLAFTTIVLISFVVFHGIRILSIPLWTKLMEKSSKFYGLVSEILSAKAELKINGGLKYVNDKLQSLNNSWGSSNRKAWLVGDSVWYMTLFLVSVSTFITYKISASLWESNLVSIGTIYMITQYMDMILEPVQNIRAQIADLQKSDAATKRVQYLLNSPQTIQDGKGAPPLESAPYIRFEQVTFHYPNATSNALSDINFSIEAGKILGIIGHTGSGKSTLAKLMVRFYDVIHGQIHIGHYPINQFSIRDLRQQIGYITQNVQLLQTTIRDNLTFFNTDISDKRVLEVIREVGLSRWYDSFSAGLDTKLNVEGGGMSAGEAQLFSIARVKLQSPKILIMDEVSSKIDPATDLEIEKIIDQLVQDRTVIIITHKHSTLHRADSILVLEAGRVIEQGIRTRLLEDKESIFAKLLSTGLREIES
jgi:ATP-binding cassette subfamily B protein